MKRQQCTPEMCTVRSRSADALPKDSGAHGSGSGLAGAMPHCTGLLLFFTLTLFSAPSTAQMC